MAKITIPMRGSLPRACLVCGSTRASFQQVSIPPSVTPRGGIPLAAINGWVTLRLKLPLCQAHGSHFQAQRLLRYLFYLCVTAIPMLLICVGALLQSGWVIAGAIAMTLLVPVAWYFTSMAINRSHVHPVAVDSREGVTLDNVSPQFVWIFEGEEEPESRGTLSRSESGQRRRRSREDDEFDDDEFDDARDSRPSAMPWVLIGVVGVVLLLGVGLVGVLIVVGLRQQPKRPGPQITNRNDIIPGHNIPIRQGNPDDKKQPVVVPDNIPDPFPNLKADPLPVDAAWDAARMDRVYLTDLVEYDAQVGWGKFGKGGLMGFPRWNPNPESGNDPILFGGKKQPRSICMHGTTKSYSKVKYRLDGKKKLFEATAALADLPLEYGKKHATSAMVLAVYGDGRLLWRSRPIQWMTQAEPAQVAVPGVSELELRVYAAGDNPCCWAIWIDPCVLE